MPARRAAAAAVVMAVGVGIVGGCGGGSDSGTTVDGKAVFATAGCGECHALRDAGATATIAPDLDALKPTAPKVEAFVTNGSPPRMPSFEATLTDEEIEAVAAYVSRATGADES